jgi:hypothetical protein
MLPFYRMSLPPVKSDGLLDGGAQLCLITWRKGKTFIVLAGLEAPSRAHAPSP